MPKALLSRSFLDKVNFDGCNLEGVQFERCVLRNCSFKNSNMANASFGVFPSIKGYNGEINCLQHSNDGSTIAIGDNACGLRLINLN